MPIHHSLTEEYGLILSEFYEASARFRAAKLEELSRVINEMEFYAVKARMEKAAEALDLAERTMLGH